MSKTLFVGLGTTPPAWYRCALPGIYMGDDADWIGYYGIPSDGIVLGGNINVNELPSVRDYDAIVVQQALGADWLETIKWWQSLGKKVIYECDDFLHGVHKVRGHEKASAFNKKRIKQYVECMKQCDAMIVSTEYLASQYKKYNSNQYICLNALDTKRYDVLFPEREEEIIIGWAGGTGHDKPLEDWLVAVNRIMEVYSNVSFCSIGVPWATIFYDLYPGRTLAIPWVSIENLPYALTNIDIVIAPAHESKYHLSKSDLRWLEASAVGLPVLADRRIYKDAINEKTAILVDGSKPNLTDQVEDELASLVYSEAERKEIGQAAKQYVKDNRDMSSQVSQWDQAISDILNS